MAGYDRFLERVRKIISGMVIVMLAVLVVIVLVAVFYRYVLSDSITWSAEVARYMCVWIGFLSASLIMNSRGHIGLEYFVNRLPDSTKRLVLFVSDLSILVFLVVVFYQGIKMTIFQLDQHSPSLQISMIWPYASVPVAACFMSLEMISLVINDFSGLKRSSRG